MDTTALTCPGHLQTVPHETDMENILKIVVQGGPFKEPESSSPRRKMANRDVSRLSTTPSLYKAGLQALARHTTNKSTTASTHEKSLVLNAERGRTTAKVKILPFRMTVQKTFLTSSLRTLLQVVGSKITTPHTTHGMTTSPQLLPSPKLLRYKEFGHDITRRPKQCDSEYSAAQAWNTTPKVGTFLTHEVGSFIPATQAVHLFKINSGNGKLSRQR